MHCVTGAFGYSGSFIAHRLLQAGRAVRTLTNSQGRRSALTGQVEVRALDFDRPEALVESLRGVKVLYNTYWVRFNHTTFKHSVAVDNTRILFEAAARAGVDRVVHTSITNPSVDSPREYFRGKGLLEQELMASGLSYAILRPAVFFGGRDILVNNIAWAVRHLPVVGVFGDGAYRIQPIHVDDFARLAVEQGEQRHDVVIDAVGPETFTYRELVQTVASIIGKKRWVIGVPPWLGFAVGWVIGAIVRDKMITWEEVEGLMADLLCVENAPPAGTTRLTDWAREHRGTLGGHYASELARRRDRTIDYGIAPQA